MNMRIFLILLACSCQLACSQERVELGHLPLPVASDAAAAGQPSAPAQPVPPLDAGPIAIAPSHPAPDAGITMVSADNGDCGSQVITPRISAPEVLIALDRSGSMVGFGNELGENRWDPSKGALTAITAQFQHLVAFGLSMFAATDPSGIDVFSCATGRLDVPLGLGSAQAIAGAVEAATPLGGATPTGATLELAARVLGDRAPKPDAKPNPAYVLLVTDGEPTCEPDPLTTTPGSIARANTAIEALAKNGVKTYVIGYGVASAAATMNGFAQRGGTERYYAVESGEQLVNEFKRITAEVITCRYELQKQPDPRKLRIALDGRQLNLNPSDGNGFAVERATLTLLGTACSYFKDGKPHALTVHEECQDVPPIF